MESYIEDKKKLCASILKFFEESDEHYNETLINVINCQQIEGDVEEMRQFLEIIKSIGEHHHRNQHFNERMNQLLYHYKDQIKQTLSNLEIFHIFENNKMIIFFLLKNDIITISDEISKVLINKFEKNGNKCCHFFIPELEKFLGEEKLKFIKKNLLKEYPNFFTKYEEKRQEGENDSYICSLIRQDLVEEFISHVTHYNISPLSQISPSIFETNPFLIDSKNITLIEYAAFFGSIQIFRYLLMNKAELTPSLWLYAIHSKNAELIHLLEMNEVPPPKSKCNEQNDDVKREIDDSCKNYERCLIESIKCHHNDIADYFENNFIDQIENKLQQNEEIISNSIECHNYLHFQIDAIISHGFFYLCFYHYNKLVKLLSKEKEKMIEKKIINIHIFLSRNDFNNEYSIMFATKILNGIC